MMAKLIADQLGYELEIVQMDWDGIIPAVQSGAVDIAICGQSITGERLEMVDFTSPYYYATIVVLTKEDSAFTGATSVADLAGANCTSQLNTIWDSICVPQIPEVNAMPGHKDAPAMLVALTSGRVDIVVTDQPTGVAATAENHDVSMLGVEGDGAFAVSDEEINIGISRRKGQDELRDSINAMLDTMTEDDFRDMMNQAIAIQPLSK